MWKSLITTVLLVAALTGCCAHAPDTMLSSLHSLTKLTSWEAAPRKGKLEPVCGGHRMKASGQWELLTG